MLTIDIEREDNGHWIAEVENLRGALAYGNTRDEALSKVKALALRILADKIENGEFVPEIKAIFSKP